MKITFIMAEPKMSGGDRVCAIYAKKFSELGHKVNVIAPKRPSFNLKDLLKLKVKLRGSKVNETQNHFDLMGIDVKYSENFSPLKNIDIPNADIVISTWWETAEWVKDFSKEKGVKVYFIQHHEVHVGQPIERVEQTYRLPFYKVTIANWLVSLMEKKYACRKPYLVPNSVNHELFYANVRGKQDVPTIGFLFSEVEFKGVKVALKVIQKLKEKMPKLRVIAFGIYPSIRIKLPEYIELSINPNQEQIHFLYQQCDVWLCCSLSEGFGLTVLEAMACRTPAVSTKCGGPEDIITDSINGYLCNVNDENVLVEAVYKILNFNEHEWQDFSNNAYEYSTKYSWDDAAKLFENSLQKILSDACSS